MFCRYSYTSTCTSLVRVLMLVLVSVSFPVLPIQVHIPLLIQATGLFHLLKPVAVSVPISLLVRFSYALAFPMGGYSKIIFPLLKISF
jgi:hypothetical protein